MNQTLAPSTAQALKLNDFSLLKRYVVSAVVALITILASPSVQASGLWDGSAGSTDWATGANWSGGVAPTSGLALTFTGTNASSSGTLTDSLTTSAFNVGGITFNSGAVAYTMTGNTFNLTTGITNNSSNVQTFNNTALTDSGTSLTFTVSPSGGVVITNGLTYTGTANQGVAVNGAGGTLTLGSLVLSTGATAITQTYSGTGNVNITGVVSNGGVGPNGLAYTGTGTLTLAGSNTYTGTTTLNSGNGSGMAYGGAINATLLLKSANALGGNGGLVLTYGTFDNASGSSLTLSGTNTVNFGTSFVTFGGTNNLNFGNNTVNFGGNFTLNLSGSNSTLTMGNAINSTGGGIVETVNGAGNTLALSSFTLSSSATANASIGGNGNITLTNGALGGAFPGGALTYNGLGNLTLGGTSTYTGGTILSRGTITLTGSIVGGISVTGGNFVETSSGSLPGAITLNGGTPTTPGGNAILSGQNTAVVTNIVNAYSTLTLDFSGSPITNDTNILASTGTLTMVGGTLLIKGSPGQTNSQSFGKYTVSGYVDASSSIVLAQNGATSLSANLGTLSRNPGAVLDITFPTIGTVTTTGTTSTNSVFTSVANGVAYTTANGGTTWATLTTVSGTGTLGALGSYATGNANYTTTNNVDVTNGNAPAGGFTVNTLRFNGTGLGLTTATGTNVVNTGGILVTPGSTGTLSGAGTLTAGTTGHELVITDNGALNVGTVIANNGATAVSVTVAGSGVTTLSGSNTYTGSTFLATGSTLAVTNASGLGSSTGTINLGFQSTLQLRSDSTVSFGNNLLDQQGTVTIDVNNLTPGTTNKTLSLGNVVFGTQQQYNVTGGNGYTFQLGNFTTAGTTNTGVVFNPTTANLTIGNITGNGAAVGNLDTFRLDGTSTGNFITGNITNPTAGPVAITKENSGTWTLTGTNTYTGATTVGGGILQIGNGTTGNLITVGGTYSALVMNGTGVINFNEAAGSAQNMGAVTFTGGDGTIQSTYGGSGNTSVTFASLGARSAGATENYVISGGANGTTNSINLTGAAAGFINQGAFFGGSSYAYMNGAGTYVRAINYSGDAAAATSAGATSLGVTNYWQTTGAVTAQATATFVTLNLAGTGTGTSNDFTLAPTGSLTISGILRSGNSGNLATVSGGAGLVITTGDFVVRTDTANDSLTINAPIAGANGSDNLVKSGAGTLNLGALAVDTFFGNTYIDGGVLNIVQESNLGGSTAGIPSIFLNGGTLQAGASNIVLSANRNVALSVASGVQTIDTQGNTMTINGVVSGGIFQITSGGFVSTSVLNKIGSGTLIFNGTDTYLSQTVISQGTLQLGNGGTSGAIDATGAIIDNGTLAFDRSNTVTQGYDFLPTITGTGIVSQIGSGKLVLSGNNTYSGGTSISSGAISINSGNSVGSGAISLATGGSLIYTGLTGTLSQNISVTSGTGILSNAGASTLTLAGTITKNNTTLVFNGGSFDITGKITGGTTSNFNSDITFTGTSTVVTLDNSSNNYTGPTNINGGGTLKDGAGTAPAGTVLNLGLSGDGAVTNTFDLNGDNQTVAAINSTSNGGNTNVNKITNTAAGSGTSTLTLSGTNSDNAAAASTYGGSITDGTTAHTALAITGGTHSFSGASTYTGGTTISNATLVATNTTGSAAGTGAFVLNSTGTLAGTGKIVTAANNTVSGAVQVGFNGTANTTGSLTLATTGTTTFSGASLTFNLNGASPGQSNTLNVGNAGNVFFGAGTTLTLNLLNTTTTIDQTLYTLFSTTESGSGSLTSQSIFTGAGFTWDTTTGRISGLNFNIVNGTSPVGFYNNSYLVFVGNGNGAYNIDVQVVPEPGTWALMLGGFALLVVYQRSRRSRNA